MTARVLMIDNYDSFTYNVVQALLELGAEVEVRRNDAVDPAGAALLDPTHIVVSPGPGSPAEAGVSKAIIAAFGPRIPVLGICLGHQAIAEVYGARVDRAPRLMHGKSSRIVHDGAGVFAGLPPVIEVGRYHSLCVPEESLPADLIVTARSERGEAMGIRHRVHPVEGVQFHPESVLTPEGPRVLASFLAMRPAMAEGAGR